MSKALDMLDKALRQTQGLDPPGEKFFRDVERHCLLCARLIDHWLKEVNERFPCPPGYRWVLGSGGFEQSYWGRTESDED